MNKEKQYWENYYKKQNEPFQKSRFAAYCVKNYLKPGMNVLELGCGNGRDAVYMAEHGVKMVAIDQCKTEIEFLNANFKNHNLIFKCDDFSRLKIRQKFDAIYSRFTLHAISLQQQNDTLNWCATHLNPNGYLLIEARGTKNEYYGLGDAVAGESDAFIYEGHYRRFLRPDDTVQKLNGLGLMVISADEKANRAPFEGTNYKFLRIIAIKQR